MNLCSKLLKKNRDDYYQFPPATLWNVFIPKVEKIWSNDSQADTERKISSFPYAREEVEQALDEYNDAVGKIIYFSSKSTFRKCSCFVNNICKKELCTFSKSGWTCQRSALLVKTNVVFHTQLNEQQRKLNESRRIQDAITTVEKEVRQYLRSDEGKVMIRSLAEQKLLLCNAPTTHDQGKKYHTESDRKNKRYNKIGKCFLL